MILIQLQQWFGSNCNCVCDRDPNVIVTVRSDCDPPPGSTTDADSNCDQEPLKAILPCSDGLSFHSLIRSAWRLQGSKSVGWQTRLGTRQNFSETDLVKTLAYKLTLSPKKRACFSAACSSMRPSLANCSQAHGPSHPLIIFNTGLHRYKSERIQH